jgi:hypothetical protein
MTYVGRAGLERLHGPSQHLHLSLREGRRSGGVITSVGHCGGAGSGWWMGERDTMMGLWKLAVLGQTGSGRLIVEK